MAKPEWGIKRLCQSCGARFYDLNRNPAECPKCGVEFDPMAGVRSRRRSSIAIAEEAEKKAAAAAKAAAAPAEEEGIDIETEDLDIDIGGDLESEEEDIIEDASELGEDDEDVPGVGGVEDEDR